MSNQKLIDYLIYSTSDEYHEELGGFVTISQTSHDELAVEIEYADPDLDFEVTKVQRFTVTVQED